MNIADKVGSFLEERVRKNGTEGLIFYNQLAAHFDLPEVDERWPQHPLAKIFEVLDLNDAKDGRPFRTTLVVGSVGKVSGQGYFNMVATLRKPRPKLTTDMNRLQFFGSELQALADYYDSAKS